MIKLLQRVRSWTVNPDTDGVAAVVLDAWQSLEAKNAEVWAPRRDGATREVVAEHVVETASL